MSFVQQVKLALKRCQSLCEDLSHKFLRGECGEKIQEIQEMKIKFAGMIELAEKLRSEACSVIDS